MDDLCAGTFSTARGCMILPKNKKFVGIGIDQICLQKSLPQLLETYARKVLNPEPDISGTAQVIYATKTLIKKVDSINFRNMLYTMKVPFALQDIQEFLPVVHHVLLDIYNDKTVLSYITFNCSTFHVHGEQG